MQILLEGMAWGNTGYAQATRLTLLALKRMGIDAKIQSTNAPYPPQILQSDIYCLIKRATKAELSEQFDIRIQIKPPFLLKKEKEYTIGYTMFEPLDIPFEIKEHIKNSKLDELWVTCTKDRTLLSPIFKNIYHIPLGVDFNIFYPYPEEEIIDFEDQQFTFITLGAWSARKGWHILIPTFLEAFKKGEARLMCIISGTDIKMMREKINEYRKKAKTTNSELPDIVLIFCTLRDEDIPKFYRSADCFVYASLGEGDGVAVKEAMACGLPVIACQGSALADFINSENAYIINYQESKQWPYYGMMSKYYKNMPFHIPNKESLKKCMHKAWHHSMEEDRTEKRMNAYKTIKENYSLEIIGKKIMNRLEKI